MELSVALVTALWFWFFAGAPGYTLHYVFKQPLVIALPIGILMGDIPKALIIGAAIELVYVGMVAAGANLPADECLAGVLAIPMAMKLGVDPSTAVVLAVPFGVLGVFLDQLRRTVNAAFVHRADKLALDADLKGIARQALIWPMAIGFVMRFPPVFIANLFGADVLEGLLKALPAWVIHGISVTGGLLPALGFAIILFVIGKKSLMPFFFIGFFAVQFLGISTMAAAVFGICMAILITVFKREALAEAKKSMREELQNS
ncbi:PTS sugar transporter subunit IIC [Petroclostridium sp. X23]|jgi:D-glucosaminate-specific PTS system IIC component|uniref:PTS mannose/fructose/sorbose/N-acetylgalactosamine transporter subunit IIC n=1 Tax=Petroclostridium sp. X23 TaxID=3045146 RepID=UPI0024ACC5D0|nr:PTS sugar transporter subunit IIC [Petroclostridium sp. X23]WHH60519.1 PTS sugar transporter subunit IIC [Petroclostridium sp. X23]